VADNWSVVGYGSDPIPDDPLIVLMQVDHINAVAQDLAQQVASLPGDGRIDAIPWQSETGIPGQFKEVVKKLPGDLDKLRARYEKVGAAVGDFQVTLANARAQARDNLTKAVAANNDIVAARAGVKQMNDFADQARQQAATQNSSAPAGTPPVDPQKWTGPPYDARLAAAQTAFGAAKGLIDDAVRQFHDASKTAAGAVNAASHDDLKNDTSILGSAVHAVEAGAHWVSQHFPLEAVAGLLNKISAVAAALSFIPAIGEIAGAIALVAAAGALVCDVLTAINAAYEGDLGWNNAISIGLDVVSVALGVADIPIGAEAKDAAKAADTASASAREADSAAEAATASRTAADAKVAAKSAKLEELTTGNRLKTGLWSFFGRTGRAETALAKSSGELAQAQAAEAQALTAANAARSQSFTADAAAQSAKEVDNNVKLAGLVTGGASVADSMVSEGYGADLVAPFPISLVRTTSIEVIHLARWNDDPVGSAAQSAGSKIVAQPIHQPSGR
jgi:hypothetical protein